MRMIDIIEDKRDGKVLTKEQIDFFIRGVVNKSIPDYQASALLMAIYFKGMNVQETCDLTFAMAYSGQVLNLSSIPGKKIDKHSTGGVGDKTTIILGPIVASLGVPVAKTSGRGLGFTGGTLDKWEAIPGYNTSVTEQEFIRLVKTNGICLAGRVGNLAPADKHLYELRDVTGTVWNDSLIAASIMSKKIASGADGMVFDIKVGSGAFMKDLPAAKRLAELMEEIGRSIGRETVSVLTSMDEPLGIAVGNSLEMKESIDVLKGGGPQDVVEVCVRLSAEMLRIAGLGSYEKCEQLARRQLKNGQAWETFKQLIKAQGGDVNYIENPELFPQAKFQEPVLAEKSGFIEAMDTAEIGRVSCLLGAGREKQLDKIDYSAGIMVLKKLGSFVEKGEVLAVLHTNKKVKISEAKKRYLNAITFGKQIKPQLILN